MNKIPYLFIKNYLLVLVALFFVYTFALDPLFHEASEDDHSNLECHFCLNEISDATLPKTERVNFLFPNFLETKNLENFSFLFYKNYTSRAPPKI